MNVIDFTDSRKRTERAVSTTTKIPLLENVLTITLRTDAPAFLGICSDGLRSNTSIVGGEFHGPQFQGVVLPGGSDFFIENSGDVAHLNARFTLRTDLGELINVINKGVLILDETAQQEIQDGVWPVTAGHYECTCTPRFQVAMGPNDWLERSAFIGKIEYIYANETLLNIYRIKY
ncbi:DUF3237 domain-containing protein [Pseudomonas sp. KFB-139]|uniref:DUF3237 domain-containing protein n=1 Tax=Pseudomonas serbiensis TaxID=3064350 RepID=A0ABT9CQZ3_9PSED|nr:DUF3237 domain-containing protein [Pseudomonas sp. KFB-138]MDO7926240.1 DUF3237 domain-containing protein [Pseudomonas sp. KFB-138]